MTDKESRRGHQLNAITGGGHPESINKGWVPGSEDRGHQPTSSIAEPTSGPTTPSGVSSANVESAASPTSADE